MFFYLWLILTLPHDRLVCELWTRDLPAQAALVQACGTDAIGDYRLDVTSNGVGICSTDASSLLSVRETCALTAPLDAYRLRIVEPNSQNSICTVKTETNEKPSWEIVTGQCPDAIELGASGTEIRYWTTVPAEPEPAPACKPPAVEQPASLATETNYYLLAGKLIWFGLAHSNCEGGYSGLDPLTLVAIPCGLDGARAVMIAWQNGLDASILQASGKWNVPASLLKHLIADETQFWSWTGVDGEHGLIQITDAGAAVVLHIYLPGYYQMTDAQKQSARSAWLRQLDCINCTPLDAYEHAKQNMDYYAQALAAYYCMYGSWEEALRAWNVNYIP